MREGEWEENEEKMRKMRRNEEKKTEGKRGLCGFRKEINREYED